MCYMSRNILVGTCIITREKNVQWPGLETGWWGPRPQCNEDVSWERGVPHGFWGPGFWNAANHGGFRKRCHEWHCASGATDPPWNRHVFKRLPRIIGSDRWTIAYVSIRRLAWPNIMLSSRHLATLLTSHYGSLFASLVDQSRLLYQLPKICSSNNIKPVFQLLQNRLFSHSVFKFNQIGGNLTTVLQCTSENWLREVITRIVKKTIRSSKEEEKEKKADPSFGARRPITQ